ncbi:MAG: hypothetical protein WA254_06175, partial [Candidatus Sulfotelmatobacter sp.]
DANDLLFLESTLAHDSSSWPWAGHSKWEKSHFDWTNFWGAGQVKALPLRETVDLLKRHNAIAAK